MHEFAAAVLSGEHRAHADSGFIAEGCSSLTVSYMQLQQTSGHRQPLCTTATPQGSSRSSGACMVTLAGPVVSTPPHAPLLSCVVVCLGLLNPFANATYAQGN
jgi:hypothetical protein